MNPFLPGRMWMDDVRARLLDRDERERSHIETIKAYERLNAHCSTLRARNSALLKASRSAPSTAASSGNGGGNVAEAYLASVEEQLRNAKADLSGQYKIQSLNAQRLLNMTDTLRILEERAQQERDELYKLRAEADQLRERTTWQKEMINEKEKQLTISQDEYASVELELNQLALQNENLRNENAGLLRRWLDLKNEEVARMNDANKFIAETNRAKFTSSSPGATTTTTAKATTSAATDTSPSTTRTVAASMMLPARSTPRVAATKTSTLRAATSSTRTSSPPTNMTTSQILKPPRSNAPTVSASQVISPRAASNSTNKPAIIRKSTPSPATAVKSTPTKEPDKTES